MPAQLTFFGTWEEVATEPRIAEHIVAPPVPEPQTPGDPRQAWLFDGPHSVRQEAEQACERIDAAALRRAWRTAEERHPRWPGARPWPDWAEIIEYLLGEHPPAGASEQAERARALIGDAASRMFSEMPVSLLSRVRSAALSRAAVRLFSEEGEQGMRARLVDGRPAGYLHLLAGNPEEAVHSLQQQAESSQGIEGRGLLLGYLGEALWRCQRTREALGCYRDAFLLEPQAVDETELTSPLILELLDACGDLDLPGDVRGWLPVLADLLGSIPLIDCRIPDAEAAAPSRRAAALLVAYRQRQAEGMADAERLRRKRELLQLAPGLKEHLRRI